MDKNHVEVDKLYQYLNIEENGITPRNILNTGTLNKKFNIHYSVTTRVRLNLMCSSNINIKREKHK